MSQEIKKRRLPCKHVIRLFFIPLLCSLPCKMGGCQAAALPGIYYEKVYSKKVIGLFKGYCFFLYLMVLLYGRKMNEV